MRRNVPSTQGDLSLRVPDFVCPLILHVDGYGLLTKDEQRSDSRHGSLDEHLHCTG